MSTGKRIPGERGASPESGAPLHETVPHPCQFKVKLLLFLVLPVVLPAFVLGLGRVLGFTVCVCFHLFPNVTHEALHSRPVMMLWETIHKGM